MLLTMWAILIVTLPTQPNAVRLRIWRALKALGCVALRDGAYLLPIEHAALLESLADEVREHGGTASVLTLSPRDEAQRTEVLTQFDRTEVYAQWRETATTLQADVEKLGETEARRRLRSIADALHTLRRIDYYPGPAAEQVEADLLALRRVVDTRYSHGEPQPRTDDGIARLDRAKFQGRRWATRARPWVDRLACAWLIRRFIDRHAEFRLVARQQDTGTRTARRAGLRLRRRSLHARRRPCHVRGDAWRASASTPTPSCSASPGRALPRCRRHPRARGRRPGKRAGRPARTACR